jgi:cob(I)alamin adenosyltransferase
MVNTGDGKGKSTAAFGVIVRGVARSWQVGVVQFIKSGKWRTGEEAVCRDRLGVDWWVIGEGFSWDSTDLTRDQAVAQAAWQHARDVIAAGKHRLVVLDEITYPMNWGWIDVDQVVTALRERPPHVNVVCTGRNAPAGLLEVADTVTSMEKVKHAYDTGVRAQRGIDF